MSISISLLTLGLAQILAANPPAVDVAAMDSTVVPGNDFYGYANGRWLRESVIPQDRGSIGVFNEVNERTQAQVQALIREAGSAPGPGAKRIGDYYSAYMNEGEIEVRGLKPVEKTLQRYARIRTRKELAFELGRTLLADVDPLNATNFHTGNLLGLFVAQGLDAPETNVPYLLQGGLNLPDRDYYFSSEPRQTQAREKYIEYLATIFKLIGDPDPATKAKMVMDLEHAIAKVSASRLESQDIHKVVSWKTGELSKKAPGLDWKAFLAGAKLQKQPVFYIWQPAAITGIAALVGSAPLEAWRAWLQAHYIDQRSPVLPKAFAEANFQFYGRILAGIEKQAERWRLGVNATNAALGEEVGRLYVAKHFSPEAKAKVQEMVKAIVQAFDKRIDEVPWMSAATKKQAKSKLHTLRVGVGYPDKWVDYQSLKVDPKDVLGNLERAREFAYRKALARLHSKVDRGEWWMYPQTVNAVNLPLQNALNFPAGILQPPFFSVDGDPAANFGSIGAVIGHEISHSFDDTGAEFDANGKLSNWWTPEDAERFKAAGELLVKQYERYEALPGLFVNGKLTLGENIADLAGLAAAYDGYRSTGPLRKVDDTLTDDQVFFIAFAQSWRSKARDNIIHQRVIVDSHAPARFRALTMRNLEPWYRAFDVKSEQTLALTPEKRVRIW